jgi:hypothetical protein
MTTRFVTAAELMARVLGMPGYPFAVITHPVSSATDEELKAMAASVTEEVRQLLLADARGGIGL